VFIKIKKNNRALAALLERQADVPIKIFKLAAKKKIANRMAAIFNLSATSV
jgi:hypothetical protein